MRVVKSQSQSKLIPDRSSNNLKVHPLILNASGAIAGARDSSEVVIQSEDGKIERSVNSVRTSQIITMPNNNNIESRRTSNNITNNLVVLSSNLYTKGDGTTLVSARRPKKSLGTHTTVGDITVSRPGPASISTTGAR
jgi:hypothetical protein